MASWNHPNFQAPASSHVCKVLEGIYVFYGLEKARIWPNETFVQSYMPWKHLVYKFGKSLIQKQKHSSVLKENVLEDCESTFNVQI